MKLLRKGVHREHNTESVDLSFKDIDEPLQKNFRLKIIEALIFAASGLIMGIMLKSAVFCLAVVIMAAFIIGIVWYQVLRCLEGDVFKFEGICIETYKDDEDRKAYNRKYILLQTKDNVFIKIYNDKASKIVSVDNVVTFYALPNSIRQTNEDSFQTDSYYYLYVKKTNGYNEYYEKHIEDNEEISDS